MEQSSSLPHHSAGWKPAPQTDWRLPSDTCGCPAAVGDETGLRRRACRRNGHEVLRELVDLVLGIGQLRDDLHRFII